MGGLTNAKENFVIDRIDRRRECSDNRDQRTARQKSLEARAAALISCAVAELPADDRADFCRSLATAVRIKLVAHTDAPGAAACMSREAYEAARDILPRKIALARAEQLFAANDRGAE